MEHKMIEEYCKEEDNLRKLVASQTKIDIVKAYAELNEKYTDLKKCLYKKINTDKTTFGFYDCEIKTHVIKKVEDGFHNIFVINGFEKKKDMSEKQPFQFNFKSLQKQENMTGKIISNIVLGLDEKKLLISYYEGGWSSRKHVIFDVDGFSIKKIPKGNKKLIYKNPCDYFKKEDVQEVKKPKKMKL